MAAPKNYDAIQLYFDYGVDLLKRRIYFGDPAYEDGNDFDFCSVATAIRAIDKMLDLSNKPIEIHMSSYGGEIDMMHALIDKIQESPCQFKFYGSGMIMSCAAWTMAVCDERHVSQHTRIMVHHGSDGAEGTMTEIQIRVKETELAIEQGVEILAKNTRMPKTFWKSIMKQDLFLNAEEAKDLGLVDNIIEYKKRGNFRRGVRAKNFASTPSASKLKILIKKLFKRTELADNLKDIQVQVPKEEFENFEEVDNTEEELNKLTQTVDLNNEQKQK